MGLCVLQGCIMGTLSLRGHEEWGGSGVTKVEF